MSGEIRIENVGYEAGGKMLLDEVTVTASAGELLGIVGPNGAGKTTLLRIAAGDLAPTKGRAIIDDRDTTDATLRALSHLRAYLGPHGVADNPFSVRDVVAMGRHPYRRTQIDPAEHDQIVDAAMDSTDISHLAERTVASLSTGERQRVGLARVLAQETLVILLDEPTSALDIGHQEAVMRLLRATADGHTAVLAVLHDLNLAAAHADRLILLENGKVRAAGTPKEVLQDDILSDVYRLRMRVIQHPERDCPLVLTLDGD